MPYGRYDDDRVIRYFVEEEVTRVLMLLGDDEIERRCRKDLKAVYKKHGFAITQIPIEDFLQPGRNELWGILPDLVEQLRNGERIVVHCHAGVGRTAVVIACLLGILHEQSADEIVAYMRHYMDITLTAEQRTFIQNWIGTMKKGPF